MYSYIQKAITLHNNKYDYSRIIELPKRYTQVDIVCPIHGIFTQSFHKHLCGDGCKKCSIEEKAKERINTYGELYQKTVMKSNIIKAKGYNLIEVWEYDWKKFTNGIICIQKKFKSRYK